MPLFLVGILGGLFTILAWRSPILALKVFLGLLPMYLLRFSILPLPSTALELFFWILFCVYLVKKHFSLSSLPKEFYLILILSLPSIFIAPNLFSALGIWKAYILEPLLFFFLLRHTLEKQQINTTDILLSLNLSAIGISLFAIFQAISGFGIPSNWIIERRVTSIFDYPNAVGLFLAPIICASITHAQKYSAHRILFLFSAILSLIACFFSKTEAVFIAIPVALFLTFLISERKAFQFSLKNVYTLVILGGISTFLFSLTVPIIRAKLFLQDFSGLVRRSQWQETLAMLFDRPFFGAGLSGYQEVMKDYHFRADFEIFEYPHNLFLNSWSEFGIIGLLGLFVLTIYLLYRFITFPSSHQSLIGFSALFVMAIHGLVDVPFFKNDLAFLTVIFLALALYSKNTSEKTLS